MRRIDEQLWFRASAGLSATVALGLMLNWLGPSLTAMPIVGAAFGQLCRVVNATCASPDTPQPQSDLAVSPPAPPAPPPPPPEQNKTDTPGNRLGSAIEIEDFDDDDQPLKGSVSAADRDDFYRFTLSKPSQFQLLIDGTTAHALLLDSSGNKLLAARRTSVGEALNHSLKADTYYIWVQPYGNREGDYNLSISANALDSREDDDTLSTAHDIGTLDNAQNFKDWVGSADQADFYRFNLSEPGQVNLLLDGKAARLLLLDANGETIARSKSRGLVNSISSVLKPGVYSVLITPASGREGYYNLGIAATPPT